MHNHVGTLTDGTTGEVWGIQSWSILENWSTYSDRILCEGGDGPAIISLDAGGGGVALDEG